MAKSSICNEKNFKMQSKAIKVRVLLVIILKIADYGGNDSILRARIIHERVTQVGPNHLSFF